MTKSNLSIKLVLALSASTFLWACGSSSGSGDKTKTYGTLNDKEIFPEADTVVGTGKNVKVGDKSLTAAKVSNNGATIVYEEISYDGYSITPVGAFAENSEIVFAGDDTFLGIDSDYEPSTSQSNLGSKSFNGFYQEAIYNDDFEYIGENNGSLKLTTSSDGGSLNFDAPSNDFLNNKSAIWDSENNVYLYPVGDQDEESVWDEFIFGFILGGKDALGVYQDLEADENIIGAFAASAP